LKRSTVIRLGLLVLVVLVASGVVATLAFGRSARPGRIAAPPSSARLLLDGTTINVQSFSVGLVNTISLGSASGGAGAGKATFQDMSLTVPVDASFPLLSIAVARGDRFQTAVLIDTWNNGSGTGTVALRYTFHTVFISSIQQSGDSGAPTETVSLKYAQAGWSYFASADTTGAPTAIQGWDVVQNQPLPCTTSSTPIC
jgi:type VI secretion system secreted protein Hcp